MPGWYSESVGYHTDDGKIFHNTGNAGRETQGNNKLLTLIQQAHSFNTILFIVILRFRSMRIQSISTFLWRGTKDRPIFLSPGPI